MAAANLRATTLGISFSHTGATPDTYEARLGSTGAWRDVTSRVWQAGRSWLYTATGLQPDTEYTLSFRASAGGNTSAPVSVTDTTLSRAIDYNARFCSDGGVNKLLLIGLNSSGNAGNRFELFINLYIGQNTRRERAVFSHGTIPNTSREVTVGAVATGERVYGSLILLVDGSAKSYLTVQFFGGDRLPACYAPSRSGSSSGSRSGSGGPNMTPTPKPTNIPDTLNYLPPEIQVKNWVEGAQGRRVGPRGVGRADLIAQGILDAVDIWSNVTPGVEVCFAQHGRIVFLDAAYAPRQLSDLPAYHRDGHTCAEIDRAGTVVLLPGPAPPPPELISQQPLQNCQVKPFADLNFRQSPPDGQVIGVTSIRDWLPASEKSHGYFKVRLWEQEGWISGAFAETRGDCDR